MESESADESEDGSGEHGSSGDEKSATYDSDGNVLEGTGSEASGCAEHESELDSDTGYKAGDNEEPAKSTLQTAE